MGTGDVGLRAKRRVDFSALRCELPPPPLFYQRQPPLPPKISITVVGALSAVVAICLIYLILEQAHVSSRSSSHHHSSFHVFKSDVLTAAQINDDDGHELEIILDSASMENEKTVIITSLNAEWTNTSSLFDLFLESLKNGNQTQRFIQHLVVVAFDKVAYSRCSALHLHCVALTTGGLDFTDEATYMGATYRMMMTNFLRTVLEKGYNFVFTDADVMWMRDPFERFYPEGDFQITCDVYGNSSTTNRHNLPIGGFVYVKSNIRTIEFYKYWQAKQHIHELDKHDQDVFNTIKFDSFIDEIGLDMRFLDTAYFGGLCEPNDLDLVVTMHANCCKSLDRKLHGIRLVVSDWKRYMRDRMEKKTKKMSLTLPRCRLNHTIITELKAITAV